MAESAAVAMPHSVKGEALYCFVTLRDGFDFTSELASELNLKGMFSNIGISFHLKKYLVTYEVLVFSA